MNGGASTTLYRSGTPALGLAASAALALERACGERENRCAAVQRHSTRLRKALAAYPAVHINSPEHAVPHILNLSVKNVKGTVFQRALSEKGVCVSVKSACSADGLPSRAVFAVSRDRRNALSSWRISEPPYHGRGNRRISVRFRRVLSRVSQVIQGASL